MSTYFQRRRERRRSRQRFEEIVAWIVVPVIAVILWWGGTKLYGVLQGPISIVLRELTSGERAAP